MGDGFGGYIVGIVGRMGGHCYAQMCCGVKYLMGGTKSGPGQNVIWGICGVYSVIFFYYVCCLDHVVWGGSPVLGAGTHYM
jgi:hypothetical protein